MEAAGEWEAFTGALVDVLDALRDMETVTLAPRSSSSLDDVWLLSASFDKRNDEIFCQAAGRGREPRARPLSRVQQATLESLGWSPPGPGDEAPWCRHRYPQDDARERERASEMLVETLRRVYAIGAPTDVKLDGRFAGSAVRAAIESLEELLRLAHSRGS